MEILADAMPDKAAIPRSTDGMVDIQSLLRLLAEQVVNAIMDEEADQLCGDGANSRNGYRNRTLETCVGTLNLRIPKLRTGRAHGSLADALATLAVQRWLEQRLVAE